MSAGEGAIFGTSFVQPVEQQVDQNAVDYAIQNYANFARTMEERAPGTESKKMRQAYSTVIKKSVGNADFSRAFDAKWEAEKLADQSLYASDYLNGLTKPEEEKDATDQQVQDGLDKFRGDLGGGNSSYGAAFSYSIDVAQRQFGSSAKFLGDFFELETLEKYGQSVVDVNTAEIAQENYVPKYEGFDDAWDKGNIIGVFDHLFHLAAENSASAVGGLAVGAGAVAGGAVGLTVAAGGAGLSALTNLGGVVEEFESSVDSKGESLYKEENMGWILGTAAIITALDVVGGRAAAGVGGLVRDQAKDDLINSTLSSQATQEVGASLLRNVAKNGGKEAVTEVMQEAVQMTSVYLKDGQIQASDAWKRIGHAALLGGFFGMAGAAGSEAIMRAPYGKKLPEGQPIDNVSPRSDGELETQPDGAQKVVKPDGKKEDVPRGTNAGGMREETKFNFRAEPGSSSAATYSDTVKRPERGVARKPPPKTVILTGGNSPRVILANNRGRRQQVDLNNRSDFSETPAETGVTVRVIREANPAENQKALIQIQVPDQKPIDVELESTDTTLSKYTLVVDSTTDTPSAQLLDIEAGGTVTDFDQAGVQKRIIVNGEGRLKLADRDPEQPAEFKSNVSIEAGPVSGEPDKVYQTKNDTPEVNNPNPESEDSVSSVDTATAAVAPEPVAHTEPDKLDEQIRELDAKTARTFRETAYKALLQFRRNYGVSNAANRIFVDKFGTEKLWARNAEANFQAAVKTFKTPESRARLDSYLRGEPTKLRGAEKDVAEAMRSHLNESEDTMIRLLAQKIRRQSEIINFPLPDGVPITDLTSQQVDSSLHSDLKLLKTINKNRGIHLQENYLAFTARSEWRKRFLKAPSQMAAGDRMKYDNLVERIIQDVQKSYDDQVLAAGKKLNEAMEAEDAGDLEKGQALRAEAAALAPSSNTVSTKQFISDLIGADVDRALNTVDPQQRRTILETAARSAVYKMTEQLSTTDNYFDIFVGPEVKSSAARTLFHSRDSLPIEYKEFLGVIDNPIVNYEQTIDQSQRTIVKMSTFNRIFKELYGSELFTNENRPANSRQINVSEIGGVSYEINSMYATPELAAALEDMFQPQTNNVFMKLLTGINGSWKYVATVGDPLDIPLNAWGSIEALFSAGGFSHRDLKRGWTAIRDTARNPQGDSSYEGLTGAQLEEKLIQQGVIGDNITNFIIDTSASEAQKLFDSVLDTDGTFDKGARRMVEAGENFRRDGLKKAADAGAKVGNTVGELTKSAYAFTDNVSKRMLHEKIYQRERRLGVDPEAAFEAATERVLGVMPSGNQMVPIAKQISRFPFIGPFIGFFSEAYRTAFNRVLFGFRDITSGNPTRAFYGTQMIALTTMTPSILLPTVAAFTAANIVGDEEGESAMMRTEFTEEQIAAERVLRSEFSQFSTTQMLGRDSETGEIITLDVSRISTHSPVFDIFNAMSQAVNDPTVGALDVLKTALGPTFDEEFVVQFYNDYQDGKVDSLGDLTEYFQTKYANGSFKFLKNLYREINGQPDIKGKKHSAGELAAVAAGVPVRRSSLGNKLSAKIYPIKAEISKIKSDYEQWLTEPQQRGESEVRERFRQVVEASEQQWRNVAYVMYAGKVESQGIKEFLGKKESDVVTLKKLLLKEAGAAKDVLRSGEFNMLMNGHLPPFEPNFDPSKKSRLGKKLADTTLDQRTRENILGNVALHDRIAAEYRANR